MSVPDSPASLGSLRGSGIPERSAADRRRQPWDVQYVGGDAEHDPFAYTRGLWQAYGHPELYADTRPVAGAEDEPEWHLTASDMGEVLNAFGQRIKAGEHFAAGDTHDLPVDEGRTTLRWAFDVAAPDWPSAHQVHPSAPVLHLSFVLSRQPVRAYAPPTADDLARLAPRANKILEAAYDAPSAWTVSSDPTLGPFVQVTEAVAHLVENAAPDDLLLLAGMSISAASWQNGALGAVAEEIRVSGRQAHLDAAQERAAKARDTALKRFTDPRDQVLRQGVMNALVGAMGAWIVADLIDEKLFHMAGGLLTGLFVGGEQPSADVQQRVDELHRRLRESTAKERNRVLRALDRSHTGVQRSLIMRQQMLATGLEPLWRSSASPVPPEVGDQDRELLTEAYETAVSALILGEAAPEQERNAALNPFRVAFKMRDLA